MGGASPQLVAGAGALEEVACRVSAGLLDAAAVRLQAVVAAATTVAVRPVRRRVGVQPKDEPMVRIAQAATGLAREGRGDTGSGPFEAWWRAGGVARDRAG